MGRMRQMAKAWLQASLARHGRALASKEAVASPEGLFGALRHHNIRPATVFDIGVADGTDWLYKEFPYAKFHLVDPAREAKAHMQEWAKRLNAETHNIALGSSPGTAALKVAPKLINTTIMPEVAKAKTTAETYPVEVVRFDQHFQHFETPALVKIDVEGFEFEVLQGMTGSLQNVDVVVVESSLISLYKGGVDFGEVIGFMHDHGFVLYDIVDMRRRPLDGALHQVEPAFVRRDAPFRVRRWA